MVSGADLWCNLHYVSSRGRSRRAENRPKTRGRIYHSISPKVRPAVLRAYIGTLMLTPTDQPTLIAMSKQCCALMQAKGIPKWLCFFFFGGIRYHGKRSHLFGKIVVVWPCRRRRQSQKNTMFKNMCGLMALVRQASKKTLGQTNTSGSL